MTPYLGGQSVADRKKVRMLLVHGPVLAHRKKGTEA